MIKTTTLEYLVMTGLIVPAIYFCLVKNAVLGKFKNDKLGTY